MINLKLGDCLDKLKEIEDNSVDSIVTDPPYGLSFMGKKWDYDVPSQEIWEECYRVLKHGGYLLSFSGSRTYHRMAVRIEDAGFEIRDQIMWIYGSGFPKSHNIGKAVDKLQRNEREFGGYGKLNLRDKKSYEPKAHNDIFYVNKGMKKLEITKGNSKYEGWGSSLKPAHEPIVMARKPLSEKTIALNVLKHGTGGINIDGSRVEFQNEADIKKISNIKAHSQGRFPANIILDDSDEVKALFPDSKGSCIPKKSKANPFAGVNDTEEQEIRFGYGSASGFFKQIEIKPEDRFFYCAKISKSDRNEGLEGLDDIKEKQYSHDGRDKQIDNAYQRNKSVSKNNHPTVKPTKLMQYLIKLVTPKDGICLDPFMGSGSTGKACKLEDFSFIGIEREAEYFKIAEARISNTEKDEQLTLF